RSPGITDLRFGHVMDTDWQGYDRFRRAPDRRTPVPLPQGVACFTVAATRAAKRSLLAQRVIGDGLVPLLSALGQHQEPQRRLAFPKDHQWIGYRMNHWDLLRHPDVACQMVAWLQPRRP
ncbi:MAG: alpha/beta hydrolase, partial [Rhodoferax sp.]